MSDIIIVHGTKGAPDINWFPWARQVFTTQGHTVHSPQFPTPDQSPAAWLKVLQAECPPLGPETTLIGHSIGATFLLHALAAASGPVLQSIFVAPVMGDIAIPEYDALNAPFTRPLSGFDWQQIKRNAGRTVVMHGDDDPYVPLDHAERLHGHVGGEICIVIGGGHLNGEAGYTSLPLLNQFIG